MQPFASLKGFLEALPGPEGFLEGVLREGVVNGTFRNCLDTQSTPV